MTVNSIFKVRIKDVPGFTLCTPDHPAPRPGVTDLLDLLDDFSFVGKIPRGIKTAAQGVSHDHHLNVTNAHKPS